jgi:hypothetical protein
MSMRFVIILLALALVGCSTAPPLQPLTAEQRAAFVLTGWEGAIPATEEGIFAKFGMIFSITREPMHNAHVKGQIDHWAELDSPGLKLKLYQMPDKELVTRVEVSDPGILLAHGAHAGMSVEQVKLLLGSPDATRDGSLVFSGLGLGADVTFHTQNQSVDRIVWEFEID